MQNIIRSVCRSLQITEKFQLGTKKKMIHKISYWWYTDIRSGGPSGYLANLHAGLLDLSDDLKVGPDIWLDSEPRRQDQTTVMEVTADSLSNHLKWFGNIDAISLQNYQVERALYGGTRSLHCHTVTDCLMTVQSLESRNSRIPILFSCHSPEAFSKEFADLWGDLGHDAGRVAELRAAVQSVELRAFEKSDIWIFPSPEALDGYEETLPSFSDLRRNKDIRFVRSGIVPPQPNETRFETRRTLGLEKSKVVLYIGRHNTTKGYDIFSAAALQLLERHDDIVMLVAGRPGPLPTLSHPRCIELGWHPDPGSLMQAADVFVLPNKFTYYDLVLLEALSLGVPVVASATGGNREVSLISHGSVNLFESGNVNEFVALVEGVLDDIGRQQVMRQGGLDAYRRYHNPQTFALNYATLINQIWLDYNIYK